MNDWLDVVIIVWVALTALSVAYVAWDAWRNNPEMVVMKWGWALVTLYTGPVGAAMYVLSCKEPAAGTHEDFVRPLWKQALGSTIHCMAGDATGVIAAAVVTSALRLSMGADLVVEYAFGFLFGLLVFQAFFMRNMMGGSYLDAVRSSFLPEWLSMNGVMAGMIPVMVVLMSRDMRAMEPSSLRFWAVMSLATMVGAVIAYPVNVWLVAAGLKHGMGTERTLGDGGHSTAAERIAADLARTHDAHMAPPGGNIPPGAIAVTGSQIAAVTVLTLLALAGGVIIAALGGSLAS